MRYDFELPDLGEGLTEAVVANWFVKAGDAITEDAPLCEIETDKALVEITAPCTGTVLETRGGAGETLAVGTVIAVFETDKPPTGKRSEHQENAAAGRSETGSPVSQNSIVDGAVKGAPAAREIRAAPAIRRLASERSIDLESIAGTGPGGRILEADLRGAEGADHRTSPVEMPLQVGQRFTIAPIPHYPGQTREPMIGLRKSIADQMVRSVTMIPHAASAFRCDAGEFTRLRQRLNESLGVRISFTAMVMKAMVPALQKFPLFNCSIDDTTSEIVHPSSINIGFATHTDDGLIVPVVKNCEDKSLIQISEEIERLAELARTRKVSREDLQGGTITLSNVGSHGRVETTGGRLIINYPQVAIIGISRIKALPVVRDGEVVAGQCLDINTSYDHRLIDGIYASLFIEHMVDIIEDPNLKLLV